MERIDGAQNLRMRDGRPWVGVGASRHERPEAGSAGESRAASADTATQIDGNVPTRNAGFPTPRERIDWFEHTQNQTHMGD